jgi:hypothetical protein
MITAKAARTTTDTSTTASGILLRIYEDITFESLQGTSEGCLSISQKCTIHIPEVTLQLLKLGYRVWVTDNNERRLLAMQKSRNVPDCKVFIHYAW